MASIKIEDVSRVFRVLTEKPDAFQLLDPQKKLLSRLEEIVKEGLYWIGLRNGGSRPLLRMSHGRCGVCKASRQVALLGILTEKQAAMVSWRSSRADWFEIDSQNTMAIPAGLACHAKRAMKKHITDIDGVPWDAMMRPCHELHDRRKPAWCTTFSQRPLSVQRLPVTLASDIRRDHAVL